MGRNPSKSNRRAGITQPVNKSLIRALSNLREKNYKASEGQNRFYLTGKDMLLLGKLINAWKDIVGTQLAHKTCPSRIIKGRLYLTVSDSQWLQTLTFIKPKILKKLNERFPEFNINEIVGRQGRIPEEAEKLVKDSEWPDWKNFPASKVSENSNEELKEIMQRCSKKMKARMEGLKQKGLVLCKICQASMTASKDGICAVCVFNERMKSIFKVKKLLSEMPWLEFDELLDLVPDLKVFEFEALKSELLDEAVELINELGEQLKECFEAQKFRLMKKEIVRAIVLYQGTMPDQIDFDDLDKDQLLNPEWLEFLSLKPLKEVA